MFPGFPLRGANNIVRSGKTQSCCFCVFLHGKCTTDELPKTKHGTKAEGPDLSGVTEALQAVVGELKAVREEIAQGREVAQASCAVQRWIGATLEAWYGDMFPLGIPKSEDLEGLESEEGLEDGELEGLKGDAKEDFAVMLRRLLEQEESGIEESEDQGEEKEEGDNEETSGGESSEEEVNESGKWTRREEDGEASKRART